MGLLHYESFISSYKLFITPVIGEADSHLLMEGRKLDDSLWRIKEQYLPRQPKKSWGRERLISDIWDCEVKELWPLQVTGNTGRESVCVQITVLCRVSASRLTLADVFSYEHSRVVFISKAWIWAAACFPHGMSSSLNIVILSYAFFLTSHHTRIHTHLHTHPQSPCWTPGDSNWSLEVRVEGQKGSGVGGRKTMVPHGYLNMS